MKPYSMDLREKILETYTEGESSYRQIAQRFRVSLSLITRVISRYRKENTLKPRPIGRPKKGKLEPYKHKILEYLELNNDLTLEQLCQKFTTDTGIKVSIPTMCRFLQGHKRSSQKKTKHSLQAETEAVQELRVESCQAFAPVEVTNIVFIDETGLQLGIAPDYGRAPSGDRVYSAAPYPHGQIITPSDQSVSNKSSTL